MKAINNLMMGLVASLVLAGCMVMERGDSRLRAPNYASPMGTQMWEVNCGRNRVYIDHTRLDQFYNADGSARSYTEFCRAVELGHVRAVRGPR